MTIKLEDWFSALAGPRWRSGIPSLDAACRGGLPYGKLVFLAGAPGAAKTSLATQWAFDHAYQGGRSVILATDEGAPAVACRVGQLLGYDRDALESGASVPDLTPLGGRLELWADSTIEDLAQARNGPWTLVVVDSLQTVTPDTKRRGKRARIEASVHLLRDLARTGSLVVCTSEMSRTLYAKGGLGAPKGTGDAEYACDLLLELLSPIYGSIHLQCSKSRIGNRDAVACDLVLDPARCRLHAVGVGEPSRAEPRGFAYDVGAFTRRAYNWTREGFKP